MTQLSLVIPQVGLPDTTEDVKIQNAFTAIQNVINGGLDTGNLAAAAGIKASQFAAYARWPTLVTTTVSVTAADGQTIWNTGGTITVTLPTPALGTQVQVVTLFSNATTVTTPSGTIYGAGLSAASFQLSSAGANVTLRSDGTNYAIVAGQQDTGWVALTLNANWTQLVGYYVPGYRLIGDRVWLRGVAQNNTGGTSFSPFATFPASIRPASHVTVPTTAGLDIPTTGVLSTSQAIANGSSVGLDGASYSVV